MTAIDFRKGFDDYVGAHQKVWEHDRSQSVGASEIFGCIRKAWAAKHDVEKDPDYKQSWGALQRGDLIENHFVVPVASWLIPKFGPKAKLLLAGTDQKTFIEGRLSATPDGLVVGVDDDALAMYGIPSLGGAGCFAFEIKSIDPRVNLKEEKTVHRGQVQTQMGLIRMKSRYKPNYAVIIYIDASFFDDIEIFVVPFDQKTFDAAGYRANEIFTTENPKNLLPEGKIEGGCDYCAWQNWCNRLNEVYTPQEGEANNKTADLELLEEFEALARRERVASAEKSLVEAEHKAASEELKHWFRETGVRRAISADANIKASISWIKGRTSYDIDAMRADGIEVENYLKVGNGYDRLNITEKGATKADE